MQIFPFTPKEVKFFKELNKHKVPYIIVGLAAAAFQGAPIVTKDVDIWVKDLDDQKFHHVIKKCGAIFIPPIGLNPPALAGSGFNLLDIVTHVHGLHKFTKEYEDCLRIKVAGITLRVLPLKRIIKSKQTLGRQKDLQVLPALKDTLIAKREIEKD